jgi:hypothetical protein
MNTATRTAVQYCLARGHTPLGIYNSWSGLLDDHVSELAWLHVDEWATRGGSELGTSRKLPDIDLGGVAKGFEKHKLDGLLIIGGFEAFSSMLVLEKGREQYDAFKVPMIHIPATVRRCPAWSRTLSMPTSHRSATMCLCQNGLWALTLLSTSWWTVSRCSFARTERLTIRRLRLYQAKRISFQESSFRH